MDDKEIIARVLGGKKDEFGLWVTNLVGTAAQCLHIGSE